MGAGFPQSRGVAMGGAWAGKGKKAQKMIRGIVCCGFLEGEEAFGERFFSFGSCLPTPGGNSLHQKIDRK